MDISFLYLRTVLCWRAQSQARRQGKTLVGLALPAPVISRKAELLLVCYSNKITTID
jgi:hypothetical protein